LKGDLFVIYRRVTFEGKTRTRELHGKLKSRKDGSARKAGDAPMKLARLLLTQLLPVVVFIIVDSYVTDERISIAAAVAFAGGQLLVIYAKTRRFDWFIVLDVVLIGVLGAISMASNDDRLFKIKPVISEGVTVVFMLALIVAPRRVLIGYFGRMMPGNALKPEALATMKTMLAWMCVSTTVHMGAVLYTAFYSSKRVWAVVSGPGLYVFFLPVVAVMLRKVLRARKSARQMIAQVRDLPRQAEV
jgi:intracellular septation protein A